MTTTPPADLSWDDLKIFMAVADTGSANKAAELLGLSHTTIGRRLKAFEQRLGVALFERSTGANLRVTSEGALAAEQARRVNEIVSTLLDGIDGHNSRVEGQVRITITEGIASFWLMGALQPFLAQNPGLTIDWLTSNISRAELTKEADLAVWWYRPEQPHIVSRRLGSVRYSLFTTPEYVARHGAPAKPDDLGGHRILHFHGYDFNPAFQRWLTLMRHYPPAMTIESSVSTLAVMASNNYLALLPDYTSMVVPNVVRLDLDLGIELDVWLGYHEDRRYLTRVRALATEVIRLAVEAQGTWFSR